MPAGSHWGNSLIGTYRSESRGDQVIITWNVIDGSQDSAAFEALTSDPALASKRLELGWMIANMLRVEAYGMLHSIPGPNEAMAESNHYSREESKWRRWALFAVGPARS
jgi:hypothetical protein